MAPGHPRQQTAPPRWPPRRPGRRGGRRAGRHTARSRRPGRYRPAAAQAAPSTMTRLAPARADSIAVANRTAAVAAKIAGLSQKGWAAQRSRHTSRAAPISAAAVSAPGDHHGVVGRHRREMGMRPAGQRGRDILDQRRVPTGRLLRDEGQQVPVGDALRGQRHLLRQARHAHSAGELVCPGREVRLRPCCAAVD